MGGWSVQEIWNTLNCSLDELLLWAHLGNHLLPPWSWTYMWIRLSILCVTLLVGTESVYRAFMPVYIGKTGDLVGWHRCLTSHRQTTEYRATQLFESRKHKRSHAIYLSFLQFFSFRSCEFVSSFRVREPSNIRHWLSIGYFPHDSSDLKSSLRSLSLIHRSVGTFTQGIFVTCH